VPSWIVEPFGDASEREVSAVLARAFAENPVARACLSHCTQEDRLARVDGLNLGLVRATLRRGTVEIVRDGASICGAQLSYAPGRWPVDARAWLSMARGALATGLRGVRRYQRFDAAVHPLHLREPHFYLWVLGVDPSMQGRGVGGALLRTFCARADEAEMPCYLETDKESSVRLYERHGFEIEDELIVRALGELRVWTMVRPPSG
jgi:ribosomal protein S18 acetylase RimI-like enzyme